MSYRKVMNRTDRKKLLAAIIKKYALNLKPATSDIDDNLVDTARTDQHSLDHQRIKHSKFYQLRDLLSRLNNAPKELHCPELDKLCHKIIHLMGENANNG
jgi:hypothetical protein